MPLSKKQQEEFRKRSQKHAVQELAKRELVNFRVDAQTIERIYSVATKRKIGISELLREYVLTGLVQDETVAGSISASSKMPIPLDQIADLRAFERMLQRILETQIRILKSVDVGAEAASPPSRAIKRRRGSA